jgi:hypothetical protein
VSDTGNSHEHYDPMVVVAANRQTIRLKSGFTGKLIWWSPGKGTGTVIVGGRHVSIKHADILCVVT